VSSRAYNGDPISMSGTPVFTDTITSTPVTTLTPIYTWKTSSDVALSGAPTNAGNYKLVVSADGGSEYSVADLEIEFTISNASQTITFTCPASGYVGDVITLSASTSTGLTGITFESQNTGVATISGNTLTLVGRGTATISASHPGNANYDSANATCNVTGEARPYDYNVIQHFPSFNGAGTRTAIVNANFVGFVRLLMDGVEVPSEHYTVVEGSTVIILNEAYLKTLALGGHTLAAEFISGRLVELNVTIEDGQPNPPGAPGTGVLGFIVSGGYLSLGLALLLATTIALAIFKRSAVRRR
jgi:hypothetical protein